jgi:hypothetical protein
MTISHDAMCLAAKTTKILFCSFWHLQMLLFSYKLLLVYVLQFTFSSLIYSRIITIIPSTQFDRMIFHDDICIKPLFSPTSHNIVTILVLYLHLKTLIFVHSSRLDIKINEPTSIVLLHTFSYYLFAPLYASMLA